MNSTVEARTHELPVSADRESPKHRSTRDRGWMMRRILLAADLVALSTAFVVVDYLFRSHGGSHDPVAFDTEFLLFFAGLPGWILLAKLYGLYDLDEERADHSTADELVRVFHLVTVGAFAFFAGSWVTRLVSPTPGKIISFWAVAVVAMTCARALARIISRRRPAYVQRTMIV